MGFESVTDSVVGIRPFHPYRGVVDPFDLAVLAYRDEEAFDRAWHRLVVVPFRVEEAYRPFRVWEAFVRAFGPFDLVVLAYRVLVAFDQAFGQASVRAFDQAFVQAYRVLDHLLVAYHPLEIGLALNSVAFLVFVAFVLDLMALDRQASHPLEGEHRPSVVDLAFEAYHLALNLEAFVVHSVVLVV